MFKNLHFKRIVFVFVCFSLIFSMHTGTIAASSPETVAGDVQLIGIPVVNYSVPYVHQLWDTPVNFSGDWACGPTSAAMALAYYRKLTPYPITRSTPYVHTNDYGYYVSSIYTAFGYTFNRMQNDSRGIDYPAYGGYGHTTDEGYASAWRIQDYLSRHGGLLNEYRAITSDTSLNDIKTALNQGYLIILSTRLTNNGHIILVKGYTDDNRLIVNDPYGNANGSSGYGKYDGGNIQYTWAQVNAIGKWMIIVKGVADSDDNRVLNGGFTINGTISPNTDEDPYTFSGSAGSLIRLTMNKTSGSLDSYLELYGPNGLVAYNDDMNGSTYDSQISATLPVNATYRVIARSYARSSSGGYQLNLTTFVGDGDDGRWLSMGGSLHGTINPNSDQDTYYINGTTNTIVSLRMERDAAPMDSYLELYDPNGSKVAYNDDGGGSGNLNSWIVYRFTTSGTYRLVARTYSAYSGGGYTVSASQVRGTNYALNKPVYISSLQDSSFSGAYAVDGNRSTRWSSGSLLGQWLYVDLGQTVGVSQVIIRWEIARATGYGIYYWNGSNWINIRSFSNMSGDTDVISFNTINARFIEIYMWARDARWSNYSLWEFEVYDAIGATAPTVPPDDPKDPETGVDPLIPLPPYPDGKDMPILALPSEQEMEPLPDATAPDPPTISLTDTYGGPVTSLTLSSHVILPGGSLTATATDAHDTDSAQVGSGIISYRWGISPAVPGEGGSSIDQLPDQMSVVISGENRTPGTYILWLQVQDDEGNWSEPLTASFQILSGIYIPLLIR